MFTSINCASMFLEKRQVTESYYTCDGLKHLFYCTEKKALNGSRILHQKQEQKPHFSITKNNIHSNLSTKVFYFFKHVQTLTEKDYPHVVGTIDILSLLPLFTTHGNCVSEPNPKENTKNFKLCANKVHHTKTNQILSMTLTGTRSSFC